MSFKLISSPLQSFTEFRFRNALDTHFGGIDTYYAPYIRLNGKMEIKANYERDLLPENNIVQELVPQVMTNDPDEFLFVVKYVQSLGYKELNWNLGCPYPMVTKRCMGSGLINDPQRIDEVLEKAHEESDIVVSMKMRMGYENPTEILDTFPILDKYPIKNIGIHARIGKQLYKGGVDLESFQNCLDKTKHTIYYNGDICSVADFRRMQDQFPSIENWMIGRGLISDPFLAQMIKADMEVYPENRWELFRKFQYELFDGYAGALSGKSHVLTKMTSFWEYFSTSFSDSHKVFKKIKKAKSIDAYHEAVEDIFSEFV
ncbi:tRNA-dihydrouridine synthase family protein [Crocinitomicaceae bacterium]|nr:tRNA-dihydrouridine synthase family protein [Crocinitomicaceae bacterium]MDC1186605.1 tRNA-dihydrouridine synthase family protein [Crocinitomicaceae bacterium]